MKIKLLAFTLLTLISYVPVSFAGYCRVSTESDDATSSYSLRYKLENIESIDCTPPSDSPGDGDYFAEDIIFETSEAGFASDINSIKLASPIEMVNTATVVIGNWSDLIDDTADIDYDDDYLDVLASAGDFGKVTIRAGSLKVGEMPFVCSESSADVYLRHLTIWTNGISYADFFDDSNPETACLKDAGNVKIVPIGIIKSSGPLLSPTSLKP